MHEFNIDGVVFRQSALKLKVALKAEAIIASAVLPALAAGWRMSRGEDTGTIGAMVAGLERIGELVDMFAGVCTFEQAPGRFVPLGPFLDLTFERKNTLLLAWLVECITWQFADFFDGIGLSLVAERVSALLSRLDSTGESGAS